MEEVKFMCIISPLLSQKLRVLVVTVFLLCLVGLEIHLNILFNVWKLRLNFTRFRKLPVLFCVGCQNKVSWTEWLKQ